MLRFRLKYSSLILAALLLCHRAAAEDASKYVQVSAEANTTTLQAGQQAVVAVVVDVQEPYHTQSHTPSEEFYIPFELKLKDNPAISAAAAVYPKGEVHDYPNLGKLNVYTGQVIVYVPITVKADAKVGALTLEGSVHFQACDNNSCYPPAKADYKLETHIVAPGEASALNKPELFKGYNPKATTQPAAASQPAAQQWTIFGHLIGADSSLLAFSAAMLVGLIFNVMPCVLPVLPLKAIGFYETSQHHRGKSFLYGVIFSLGIVFTFAVLALLVLPIAGAGDSKLWGNWFSKAYVVWPLAVILVLMGLGAFGLFTFRLPLGVYTIEPKHDSYIGNFLFGILTAVLSTPCTAPLFPGLLVWAAAQSHAGGRWIGVGVMLFVGVGMALPYLLLSALPELARRIPRTGPWSELVKQMMGFLLFGVAAYFVGLRLLPGQQFIWLVFGVMIVAGIFLIARTAQLMPRARPVFVSFIIALLLVGGTFKIARALTQKGGPDWIVYSPAALEKARQEHSMVLIDFTANYCQNCHYLEATVFHDPATLKALDRHKVIAMKADLSEGDQAAGTPLLKQLNPSSGIPLTAIYPAGAGEPTLLASIYTRQTLINTLNRVDPMR
jgi:thiol:disulfide interchange protein DsbD